MIKSLLLVVILGISTSTLAFDSFEVEDIRLEGVERISHGTIFTYLPIERGDDVNQRSISRAVKSLFLTGIFLRVLVLVDERTPLAKGFTP